MTPKEQITFIEMTACDLYSRNEWKGRESAVVIAKAVGNPSSSQVQRIAEEAIDKMMKEEMNRVAETEKKKIRSDEKLWAMLNTEDVKIYAFCGKKSAVFKHKNGVIDITDLNRDWILSLIAKAIAQPEWANAVVMGFVENN